MTIKPGFLVIKSIECELPNCDAPCSTVNCIVQTRPRIVQTRPADKATLSARSARSKSASPLAPEVPPRSVPPGLWSFYK